MADRGRADPVTVEDEVDPPAGTEYLPDENAIRYVAYLRGDDEKLPERESAYETRPFEDWATSECASLGQARVAEVVESRLDDDQSAGYAWGKRPDGFDAEGRNENTGDNRDRDNWDGDGSDGGDGGGDSRNDGDHDHSENDDFAVIVEIRTMRDRKGNVISEPTVEYEDLREVTPEAVTATVRFAGREHTETFPVVVRETEGQFL